jgi:hypothetical protein
MTLYTFHVTIVGLDNLWRKISIRGEQTLNVLHEGIQAAFEFDNDHMYSFYLSGKAWDKATEYAIPEGYGWGKPKRVSHKEREALFINMASQVMDRPKMSDVQMISEVIKAYPERGKWPDDASLRRIFPKMAAEPIERLQWYYLPFAANWIDTEVAIDRNVFETKIESLPLKIGQSMLYLFDYGDEWHFKVLLWDLEKEEKANKREKYPKLIAFFGVAPEQYEGVEDDDWGFDDEDDFDEDEELESPQILPTQNAESQNLPEGIPPNLPKFLYRWHVQVKRPVIEPEKAYKDIVNTAVNSFLETEFKPRFADKITAISSKWLKRFCYIQATMNDGSEKKLVRFEFAGEGRFHLAGLDAKGNWREDYEYAPLKYCFVYMLQESRYQP